MHSLLVDARLTVSKVKLLLVRGGERRVEVSVRCRMVDTFDENALSVALTADCNRRDGLGCTEFGFGIGGGGYRLCVIQTICLLNICASLQCHPGNCRIPGCVPVLCRTKVPPYHFLVAPVILSYQWPTRDVIDERTPAYSSCKVELVLDLSLGETPERISDGSGRNGSFMPALPRGGMWWQRRRRRRCASRYDITTRHQTR